MVRVDNLGLKKDVAKLMGSLFGNETEKMFLDYYDESNPEELINACKEMIIKLLGRRSADKYLKEIIKKYPELEKPGVVKR